MCFLFLSLARQFDRNSFLLYPFALFGLAFRSVCRGFGCSLLCGGFTLLSRAFSFKFSNNSATGSFNAGWDANPVSSIIEGISLVVVVVVSLWGSSALTSLAASPFFFRPRFLGSLESSDATVPEGVSVFTFALSSASSVFSATGFSLFFLGLGPLFLGAGGFAAALLAISIACWSRIL